MRRPNIEDNITHRMSSRMNLDQLAASARLGGIAENDEDSSSDPSILGSASKRPACASVEYFKGKPVAHRPEDAAPAGATQDMRHVPGAPEEPGELSEHGDAEFFSATSWLMQHDADGDDSDDPIVTGHGGEPHIL